MKLQSASPTLLLKRLPLDDRRIVSRKTVAQRLHLDVVLLATLLALMVYGLIVLYSATNGNTTVVYRQAGNFLIGLVLMFAVAQIDIDWLWRYIPLAYIVGILALLLTDLIGITINGSQRWLGVAGVLSFQPSEFMKLVVPLMVVWCLSRDTLPARLRTQALAATIIILPAALVLAQPDLGTAIIICGCGLFALFLAGLPYRIISLCVVVALVSIPLVWEFMLHAYHQERILTFLNPYQDPLGAGWNAIQSMIAIGSGGLTGKGWMMNTQAALGFLPESHTDFIFSVLSEDFGLVGFAVLVFLYVLLIWRGLYIAASAQLTKTRLTAASLIMIVLVYMFINIAMVSALLPVVGVPLPFISYGGTSAVSILIALGVIMSIATHKRQVNR